MTTTLNRDNRHFAVAGISYSGSTIFSCAMGGLAHVANIGESHWLYDKFERELEPPHDRFECAHCGVDCKHLTPLFQRNLHASVRAGRAPHTWYEILRRRLGKRFLVSSDKNYGFIERLGGCVQTNLVVLYKSPAHSWWSNRKKASNTFSLEEYLKVWTSAYAHFLDKFACDGDMIFVNFEDFCAAPEASLKTLAGLYGLGWREDALRFWERPQHYVGGHFNIYRLGPEKAAIRPLPPHGLPEEEVELIAQDAAVQSVFQRMEAPQAPGMFNIAQHMTENAPGLPKAEAALA